MAETFLCTLVTPERQVLEKEVTYASIPAWDGEIGLLHQRAPLLAKLGYGLLRLTLADGGSEVFFVGGGFAQMKDNKLAVLTDEAIRPDEIEPAEAGAALKAAENLRGTTPQELERRERDLARARAMVAMTQPA